MYRKKFGEKVDKRLRKLAKKNSKAHEAVWKKVNEILTNPNHYKNLKRPLQRYKRVHIGDNSFLLCFRVDEENRTVVFVWFGHHDDSY